jgi:hypothetical protein
MWNVSNVDLRLRTPEIEGGEAATVNLVWEFIERFWPSVQAATKTANQLSNRIRQVCLNWR